MPTQSEFERAYTDWYCVTAKNPVPLEQYIRVMGRLPEDIKQINEWLDEGKQPI